MLSTKIKIATVLLLAINCRIVGVGSRAREQAEARIEDDPPAAQATNLLKSGF